MSASKQKKVRSEGVDKRTAAAQEAAQKNKKFRRNTILVVLAIVLVLAAAIFINSNYLYTKTAALTVGDTKYSATEFNFYYRNIVNQFYQENSDYLSLYLDTSSPLDKQTYIYAEDDSYTWADFFKEQTENSLQQITALYDEAQSKGFTLSEEDLATIDNNLYTLGTEAASRGYTTDAYLALAYGKDMNEKNYRANMEHYLTAMMYRQSISDSFSYTDEELSSYYTENMSDSYARITYLSRFFGTVNDQYDDLPDNDAKMAAALEDANEVAEAAKDPESFTEAVKAQLTEENAELITDASSLRTTAWAYNLNSAFKDWLTDDARQEGDTYVAESASGVYVVYYESTDNNDYNLVNVRHILCTVEEDENGDYTEEAKAAAEAKAEMLYRMWMSDPTEENFAEIANTNSDDSGSNTNGGLYENVYKGQMVKGFEDFCFAEHESGDTDIVYGESAAYAGYHIMYYVGEGPVFANYLAENEMRTNDLTDYVASLAEGYTVSENAGMRFAHVS